jgi:hypothetical protein
MLSSTTDVQVQPRVAGRFGVGKRDKAIAWSKREASSADSSEVSEAEDALRALGAESGAEETLHRDGPE